MDNLHEDAPLASDDLSALAWVHEELRKSLDAAHKALHRVLKDSAAAGLSDLDALDPAVLRTARQQIHQGVGALELAGLSAGATLLRASEAVVQKFVNRPQAITEDAVRDVERGSFALLDYIGRKLAGKPVSALALFPQYEALATRAGGPLPRPTDLWSQDWPTVSLEAPLAPPDDVSPRQADQVTIGDFEMGLLSLLKRNQPADAVALAELCTALASGAAERHAHRESATWLLASGFLEGVAEQHVPLNVHAKRVLSSLLSQLRSLAKGQGVPSDRLASELLFFCAQAGQAPASPRSVLARVRQTFGLERHQPVDLQASPLGRFDPSWIAQATKRVAGAKDGWSAVAAGEMLRMAGLNEQFSLVGDSLRRLFPSGERLADALVDAVQRTVQSAQSPEPSLAMEVATSLLYLEAALEDGEFEHPEQVQRVSRMAERIDHVNAGQPAEPLEGWMEDLYRRVSDRQTMGSVVQELRSTLGESEKHIDAFFRAPQDRTPLVNVPSQLQSMRGVLAVLGLDQASQAVVRMRGDVEHLLQPDADLDEAARQGVFDRLASNLGALGFLIDMMGVQPGLAKSLFSLDEDSGVLSPLMGREKKGLGVQPEDPVEAAAQHVEQVHREEAQAVAEEVAQALAQPDAPIEDVSEQLQKLAETPHLQVQSELADNLAAAQAALAEAQAQSDDAALEAAREQVAQVLSDLTPPETEPVEPEAPAFPPQAPLAPTPVSAPQATGLEEDDEMRGIFLEEAAEVIAEARQALSVLRDNAADVQAMTGVRRAFHTLKGSSRMVGLTVYGEAAWACEQLYNAALAAQEPASADLLGLSEELFDHFAAWTDAIARRNDAAWRAKPVIAAADALRLRGERVGLSAVPEPEGVLELDLAAEPEPAADPDPLPSLDLALDLSVVNPLPPDGTPADVPVLNWATDEVVSEALARLADEGRLPGAQDAMAPVTLLDEPVPASPEALAHAPFDFEPTLPGEDLALASVPDAVPEADSGAPDETLIERLSLDLDMRGDDGLGEFPSVPATDAVDAAPTLEPILESLDIPLDGETTAPAAEAGDALPMPEMHLLEPSDFGDLSETSATQPDILPPVEDPVEPDVLARAEVQSAPESEPEPEASDEQVKVVGPLRISIPLFNIYLNEADEQSRRLCTQLGEWALELHHPVGDDTIALAHSLAGNSATVGYTGLSQLARLLEHALMRSQALGPGDADAAALFNEAADEIRRLLHQFAAGFLKSPDPDLLARLADYDQAASQQLEARSLRGDPIESGDDDLAPPAGRGHLRLVHSADEPIATEVDDTPADAEEPTTEPQPLMPLDEPTSETLDGIDIDLDLGEPAEAQEAPSPDAAEAEASDARDASASDETPVDTISPDAMVQPDEVIELDAAAPGYTQPAPLGVPEFRALDEVPVPQPGQVPPSASALATQADWDDEADVDAEDHVDPDLFPIFEEEAQELLPQLANQIRQWLDMPENPAAATACMRTLHTFKGGARLAGAMRLGELAHRLESRIERLLAAESVQQDDIAPLESRVDRLVELFEGLRHKESQELVAPWPEASAEPFAEPVSPDPVGDGAIDLSQDTDATPHPGADESEGGRPDTVDEVPPAAASDEPGASLPEMGQGIDWAQLDRPSSAPAVRTALDAQAQPSQAAVRVRPQLLDRLVNHAGEVSITRTRLQSQVGQIRGSLTDLTDNLDRLRQQLRDIELQAETQLSTRMEAARAAAQNFDPLEFDRYTRFQELTRMMAESVNDVATVQRTLQRNLETAEDQLAAQARLTRDLQDDLLRTRMVEFDSLSDRLYRVVRQAAKETGKQVRLDVVGGQTEVDRGVLERMTGAFEHLLRNCITHGIESPEQRQAAGKDASGQITVALKQEGNEVVISFRDDGAGLDLQRIAARARASGLLAADAEPTEAELAQLIFTPGFSTAEVVTELAGRGIGMDVVRSEVNAMGGRIETASASGQGTSFTLVLPLTTAVTKVVMLRFGTATVAVPTHLIEIVRRARPQEVEQAYREGRFPFGDQVLPFYWLGALLSASPRGSEGGRSLPVVVVRSAQQRVALHVDEVLGNQEVVVKHLGPQLSRLPGLAGMTLLASGAVSLIYNPVALATVYGDAARAATAASLQALGASPQGWLSHAAPSTTVDLDVTATAPETEAPLVLVVDDSLTVRKVTQRLLVREGYRVILAKDGLEALERLAQERPTVVLSDIEMPRMDGFDLLRNVRADGQLADLPVIMITSRIAQKHRDVAMELGANHYLGKPYGEEELLALVARYALKRPELV
ncbi:hybrid sensor histidine kinase/response regulator [Aquabacterium olei]|uniref:Chemotaxis protein CheA n=1 Tax=Aquabacterium olei TaxID=1296669 RepID=A0A2U8FUX8_9BURK|nr:Hpt domain-containing protein [Aquabacterium olei]AWI54214.1 hybrid sensor histidine kinase/response regulator [Aquabacterium olei]